MKWETKLGLGFVAAQLVDKAMQHNWALMAVWTWIGLLLLKNSLLERRVDRMVWALRCLTPLLRHMQSATGHAAEPPACETPIDEEPINLPVLSVGKWPEGMTLRREDLYGDDGR